MVKRHNITKKMTKNSNPTDLIVIASKLRHCERNLLRVAIQNIAIQKNEINKKAINKNVIHKC